tara:strand:- start:64899 stop:65231 length:333 start_codon:yes stop_codon:yes gene_type:complete
MTETALPHDLAEHRQACTLHSRNRAQKLASPMSLSEIEALSRHIDLYRPAFQRPGQTRYLLGVHRGNGERFRVIYDTSLKTIVTIHYGLPRSSKWVPDGTSPNCNTEEPS